MFRTAAVVSSGVAGTAFLSKRWSSSSARLYCFGKTGVALRPADYKLERGGEDGFFIAPNREAIGVADGVGGWAEQGVNPAIFTWTLMKAMRDIFGLASETKETPNPADVLATSLHQVLSQDTSLQGSCTLFVAALNCDSEKPNLLTLSQVGDCSATVIRPLVTGKYRIIFNSEPQQRRFNFPYQVGSHADNPRKVTHTEALSVESGDVVILCSDGVLDNVTPEDAAQAVASTCPKSDSAMNAKKAADVVAALAYKRSLDRTRQSPFALEAARAGLRFHGGKKDDIAVLIGVVLPRDEVSSNKPPKGPSLAGEYFNL